MARNHQPPPEIPPSIPAAQRAAHVQQLLERGKKLRQQNGLIDEQRFTTWKNLCDEELVKVFGSASQHLNAFQGAGVHMAFFATGDYDENASRAEELDAKLGSLASLIEMLEVPLPVPIVTVPDANPDKSKTRNVFVVHGHDNAAKAQVARVLEKLQLVPIILHEVENGGKTIIEKFETHATNAAFAVVLLTPDDEGRARNTPGAEFRVRARQNVVLELGYFLGKLGRPKVCALYSEGVELPSDLQGVLWVPLDSGGVWAYALAKELRGSGLSVDLNNL